jgi:hypothetical protein
MTEVSNVPSSDMHEAAMAPANPPRAPLADAEAMSPPWCIIERREPASLTKAPLAEPLLRCLTGLVPLAGGSSMVGPGFGTPLPLDGDGGASTVSAATIAILRYPPSNSTTMEGTPSGSGGGIAALAADFLFFEEESDDLPVGVVASDGVDLRRL